MPTPDYILDLRRTYGSGRLLLPGVSAVVVRDDLGPPGVRHLLLVRRSDNGQWSVPAGIVEPGEQPAATMVRELLEETRVQATVDRLVLLTMDPEITYPNGDICQYVALTFRATYLGGEAVVGDDESTEVGWFVVDALPAGLSDEQLRRIACGLDDRPACVFDV